MYLKDMAHSAPKMTIIQDSVFVDCLIPDKVLRKRLEGKESHTKSEIYTNPWHTSSQAQHYSRPAYMRQTRPNPLPGVLCRPYVALASRDQEGEPWSFQLSVMRKALKSTTTSQSKRSQQRISPDSLKYKIPYYILWTQHVSKQFH